MKREMRRIKTIPCLAAAFGFLLIGLAKSRLPARGENEARPPARILGAAETGKYHRCGERHDTQKKAVHCHPQRTIQEQINMPVLFSQPEIAIGSEFLTG
jgi:hypothetical protein